MGFNRNLCFLIQKGESVMKKLKLIISLLLVTAVCASSFVFPTASASAASVKVKNKTLYLYTEKVFSGGNGDKDYFCTVENKEYVNVDFIGEYGTGYDLTVSGKKLTGSKKPLVTIYYKNSAGKKIVVKKYRFTVKRTQKVNFKDVYLNKGTTEYVFDSFKYTKRVKYSFSKKGIASIKGDCIRSNELYYSPFMNDYRVGEYAKGLKFGKTKVTVKLKGTNVTLGKFYIIVKNIKPSIKKSRKTVVLRYNKHGYVYKGTAYLLSTLNNTRKNAKYSLKIRDKKIARAEKYWYRDVALEPAFTAKKVGKTKADVYEKLNGKKTKIGTLNIKVKKAKMAEVMRFCQMADEEGIYYFVKKGDKVNLKSELKGWYLRYFKSDEYKITFKSSNPKVISVNSKGVVKCLTEFNEWSCETVRCTVKFSDGSKDICYASFEYGSEEGE